MRQRVKPKLLWQSTQWSHKKSNTFITYICHVWKCAVLVGNSLAGETQKEDKYSKKKTIPIWKTNKHRYMQEKKKIGTFQFIVICHWILRCPVFKSNEKTVERRKKNRIKGEIMSSKSSRSHKKSKHETVKWNCRIAQSKHQQS